jgi:hypothetical protein
MRQFITTVLLSVAGTLAAQAPTWSDDVACIVYSHCTSCHHPGGLSGETLDLMSFTEAQMNRDDISMYVGARVMPPWPPDPNYRSLAHERTLTQDEIDIIAAWAAADGPEGNTANAPAPPVYLDENVITAPDITTIMPAYTIPSLTDDLYRCFVLPINNTVDNFIKRLEVIPGNRQVVHHVLVYQDGTGQAAALDAQDPELGYSSFGGIGVSDAQLIGIWVPGSGVMSTPDGMGIKLLAGADIVIQVHYPLGSDGQVDSTRVSIEYCPPGFTRELSIAPILDHLLTITDGPLVIPPNEVRTFHAEYTTPIQATITAIGPHAHLLCTSMKAWAITPAQDSIPLISIPHWDFHWQGLYEFRNPIFLPEGTILRAEATYDNTVNNPENPNSPPNWVTLGEATTDEMMLFYFTYTFGLPTDEQIVVDNSAHAAHHLDCTTDFNIGTDELDGMEEIGIAPIPATSFLNITLEAGTGWLRLLDVQGREVERVMLTGGQNTIDVSHLSRGSMIAEVRGLDGTVRHRRHVLLQ